MKIDWRATQKKIGAGQDGDPGRETYGRLFAYGVNKAFTPTHLRLGEGAAKHFPTYGVADRPERIAGFIAETGHESGGFSRFEENLNYSAQGLANTWPSRFAINPSAKVKRPNAQAVALARRPQAIAIATYGARMGNLSAANDTDAHPDGWQYRGRSMIQLTGRANYERIGKALGLDLVNFPELAADPAVAVLIALEFMKGAGTFKFMDDGKPKPERQSINGGLIGFDDVQAIRLRTRSAIVLVK